MCGGTCTGGTCLAPDGGVMPTTGGSDGGSSGLGCYGCTTTRAGATPWLGFALGFVALVAARGRKSNRAARP
jgi:hypothetical protein